MHARSAMCPTKETREPGGAQMVAITLVPKGRRLTRRSAVNSIRFKTSVSLYKKAKKTIAHAPKPARCHFLGFRQPIRQRPKMAVIAVRREASRPIQAPVIDGRKFSGNIATPTIATRYNSAGRRKDCQKDASHLREMTSVRTQSTPKMRAARPRTA